MKNKFLALAAFGTAIVGGAILSAPANAQIAQGSGPSSTINVNVNVPEILFLRTVQNASVDLLASDLVTGAGGLTPIASTTPPAYIGGDQTTGPAGTPLNTASPFALTGTSVTKSLVNSYIVWSNSPTGNYTVAITPSTTFTEVTSGNTLAVTVNPSSVGIKPALGLTHGTASNIDLDVPISATAAAGSYAGTLLVEAYRP
ncbi:hypothetical protein FD724_17040 [Nostoc sp. C057]|uniref:hypothetical protein n=1 Tax=Nostoc sp. C057 TaxID=2576903 RepID=UPI0015C2FF2F|nr:hypothetical protein [Nostoc sp. C057]QLE49623.1 hypothetical protein FD724_17040 [Nostoc sp. C057]